MVSNLNFFPEFRNDMYYDSVVHFILKIYHIDEEERDTLQKHGYCASVVLKKKMIFSMRSRSKSLHKNKPVTIKTIAYL